MPKRILRISVMFPPPWEGLAPGPYELTSAQAKLGHHLHVLTPNPSRSFQEPKNDFVTERIQASGQTAFGVLAHQRTLKLLEQGDFDYIHSHGSSALPTNLVYRQIEIRFGTKLVNSVHICRAGQFQRLKDTQINCYYRQILKKDYPPFDVGLSSAVDLIKERLFVQHAHHLFAVSQGIKDELVQYHQVDPKCITVTLNGVNLDRFTLNEKEQEELQSLNQSLKPGLKVLFVGMINGRKGEDWLLQAFSNTKPQSESQLIFIGRGPRLLDLKAMCQRLGQEKRVHFVQNVPYHKIKLYFHAADIFALPSASEGLPKVLPEAMACHCAVITTDTPGCREVVEDRVSGRVVPFNDLDALQECLNTLLDDPAQCQAMAQAARQRVQEQFTWEQVARRIDRVYQEGQ